DGAAFRELRERLHTHYTPQGPVEEELVDRFAQLMWRARRGPRAEANLLRMTRERLKDREVVEEDNGKAEGFSERRRVRLVAACAGGKRARACLKTMRKQVKRQGFFDDELDWDLGKSSVCIFLERAGLKIRRPLRRLNKAARETGENEDTLKTAREKLVRVL